MPSRAFFPIPSLPHSLTLAPTRMRHLYASQAPEGKEALRHFLRTFSTFPQRDSFRSLILCYVTLAPLGCGKKSRLLLCRSDVRLLRHPLYREGKLSFGILKSLGLKRDL